MDNAGHGQEIQLRNLAANAPLSLCNWKNSMVRERVGDIGLGFIVRRRQLARGFFTLVDWHSQCSLSGMCKSVVSEWSASKQSRSQTHRAPLPQDRACFEKLPESSVCRSMAVPGPLLVGGLRLYHGFHQGSGNCNCTQARRHPSEPREGKRSSVALNQVVSICLRSNSTRWMLTHVADC